MYHNYFFINRLSKKLSTLLTGAHLTACFSQNKNELIFGFTLLDNNPFYIQANLDSQLNLWCFPKVFNRAKKNSVNLFESIIGKKILAVNQTHFDRSFELLLNDHSALLFQLYGRRSNISLINKSKAPQSFKSKLMAPNDSQSLARDIDVSILNEESLEALEKTFDQDIKTHLKNNTQYEQLDFNEKKVFIPALIESLNTAHLFISDQGLPKISLFDTATHCFKTDDPIIACNELYKIFTQKYLTQQKKDELTRDLNKKRKQAANYIEKSEAKISHLRGRRSLEEIAHIIMANLHNINPNDAQIEVPDLYHETANITIKLKPQISPQKNAEILYRKSKNQKLEINNITENIAAKKKHIQQLDQKIAVIKLTKDWKALQHLIKTNALKKPSTTLPFNTFSMADYSIYVGRNNKSNDLLTFDYAKKDDLWLHVKDAPGSHVVIKKQGILVIPKPVIERAAELAAYFSKRKTENMAPVIYTERKYVRKIKGSLPGQVAVMKEKVLLVQPKL
jgi:predicted ribosome quality control (RQC) complex YloA/Tae2 family protein